MTVKKCLVHIYTGEGKGKTTAALGLGFRACGCGIKVCMLQFFKDRMFPCGEAKAAKRLRGTFTLKRFDIAHPMFSGEDTASVRGKVKKALARAAGIINSEKYGLVILDEILIGVGQGLIDENAVLGLIKARPEGVELVLTGRGATPKLKRAADYVTYMKEVKHPFRKKVVARRGIEY